VMLGASLRDAGIARVMETARPWADEAQAAFAHWLTHCATEEFSLEQFRAWAEANGLPQPHHPNAWGGLTKKLAPYITPVGFTQSTRTAAHARLTRTYRKKTHV
jgi:hypothetical protein